MLISLWYRERRDRRLGRRGKTRQVNANRRDTTAM